MCGEHTYTFDNNLIVKFDTETSLDKLIDYKHKTYKKTPLPHF